MTRGNKKSDICNICKKTELPDNAAVDYWMGCDCCRKWYHTVCCSINSREEYDICCKKKRWFCPYCVTDSNINVIASRLATNVNDQNFSQSSNNINIHELIDEQLKKLWPSVVADISSSVKKDIEPRMFKMEQRINFLERSNEYYKTINRAKNLIIQGAPEDNDEENVINRIAAEINVQNFAFKQCVDYTKRFKQAEHTKKPGPLLVRFATLIIRNEFMSKYLFYIKTQNLPTSCINQKYPEGFIFINEHLDKSTHKLFMRARNLVKENTIYKASLRKSLVTIQVNKMDDPILIKSEADLNKFKRARSSTPTNSSTFYSSNGLDATTIEHGPTPNAPSQSIVPDPE